MYLLRKIAGTSWTEFDLDVSPKQIFVKNFTAGDILVSLGDSNPNDENTIKIPTGMGQVCFIDLRANPTASSGQSSPQSWRKTYIKAVSAGDVELQVLVW